MSLDGLTRDRIAKLGLARKFQVPTAFESLTGLETILGETRFDSFKLAVDQINAGGDIAGCQVETIVEGSRSNEC